MGARAQAERDDVVAGPHLLHPRLRASRHVLRCAIEHRGTALTDVTQCASALDGRRVTLCGAAAEKRQRDQSEENEAESQHRRHDAGDRPNFRVRKRRSRGVKGTPTVLLIYGANGYTGDLIARRAAQEGVPAVLAGRNGDRLRDLAGELQSEQRTFVVDDVAAVDRALAGVTVVLNCAGP